MACQDLATFSDAQARLIARLHAQSGCERWALSQDALAEALHRSTAHRFPDGATDGEVARYLATLHVEDLALATACRGGNAAAWDHFVLDFLYEHLRENRITFIDLNQDDVAEVSLRSRFTGLDRMALPVELLQSDFIVSMPKLKTHHWAGITASMKNLFGTVPGAVYGWPKNIVLWIHP